MNLDAAVCLRALRAKDRRFDGRFFVGIASTKIYCRPICPARAAKRANITFYPSAAAAESQGYRPCLRCRPERAPGFAPVDAVSRLVASAMARIEEHSLSSAGVADLALRLGVSVRHLRRVILAQLGVSPIELAQTQRLLLAKRLMAETDLALTEIAFASGFNSVRRFNALFKSRYGLSPRSLRRGPAIESGLHCQLEFRPPLAWNALLDYLHARALAGVETVSATHYRRTVRIGEHRGWISVGMAAHGRALDVELSHSLAPVVAPVLARVKRLFDLGAVPAAIEAHLREDRLLTPWIERLPGLRVPGAFDGFELAVRAVLGQQVSVRAAGRFAARWAEALGEPIQTPYPELSRLSPTVESTAGMNDGRRAVLGLTSKRFACLIALARAAADGDVALELSPDIDSQLASLQAIAGIGPWTAQYIGMGALQWPDAFPAGDLILMRTAKSTAKQLSLRAESWRPWRSYAAHYLWQSAGVGP